MSVSLAYGEHRPPADLSPWIACFWHIKGEQLSSGSRLHRVLPDGCADLVFDIGAARQGTGGAAAVVGPMSVAVVFPLCSAAEIFGVRLRPGALAAFCGIPAGILRDSSEPVSDLPHRLEISDQQLAACASDQARLDLLAATCRTRLATLNKPDPMVGYALARWSRAETAPFPTVAVLTRDVGLSERAFERRFVAQVGLTPVHYRRLARFRGALRLYAQGARSWAAIAHTTAFSDQSHLVREFRAFAGLTPDAWAGSQAAGFLQDGHITTL